MYMKRYKILSVCMLLLFFLSCVTQTHIAPTETDKIQNAKKILVKLKDDTELELTTINVEMEKKKIVGYTMDEEKKEVSFELIREVILVEEDYTFAYLYGAVAIVGAWLLIRAETAPEPPPTESCPFIYSFDGEKYIFDAEPYGGAICQGLKRTEWCRLNYIKDVSGQYNIMIINELEETQYTDELKIIVVDHPRGTLIAPDISGRIHTFSQLTPPTAAYDSDGNDLLPLVSNDDDMLWQSKIEGKSPDREKDLKDELVFEFQKPRKAEKAKLVVNALTTLWGSYSVKQYLSLYGNKIQDWYDEVNQSGPALFNVINMHVKEELYALNIQVKTKDGWKSKGLIRGGGPLISENKTYLLDISDVQDDVLEIKLTPPLNFWMINYLAVDYTEDLPVTVTEMEAKSALDQRGQNVSKVLADNDNKFLVMPNIGDRTQLVFDSPPLIENMERSVILKASGYYDIHLQNDGEPQLEIIEKFQTRQGFVIQYAFKEYLKWKEEKSQKMSLK